MKTGIFNFRKLTGFTVSMMVSIMDTPKGKIKVLDIKDQEPSLTDKEPTENIMLSFDNYTFNGKINTEELKDLCEFLLEIDNEYIFTRAKG